jgi:magnesium chelatase subunit I
MHQESRPWSSAHPDGPELTVKVPDYLAEVVATVSQLARSSPHVNQRSGVSVRMSVTNLEAVAANAVRRTLRAGETTAVARVDDLEAMSASSGGKIEIESLDDSGGGAVFDNLVKGAVLTVYKERVAPEGTRGVVTSFEEGAVADIGEDIPSAQLAALVDSIPALRGPVHAIAGDDASVAEVAAAVSFVLEGLHLAKRLNKDTAARAGGVRTTYRSR